MPQTSNALIKATIIIAGLHPGKTITGVEFEDGSGVKFNYRIEGVKENMFIDLFNDAELVNKSQIIMLTNDEAETVSTHILSQWFKSVKEESQKPHEDRLTGYSTYLQRIVERIAAAI